MFSAHLFDYSSKPLYYHPDKNHIIIVTTTWKRHTFPPQSWACVYIKRMGGRGRGAREEINAKLDSNQKTTCVLCFVFFLRWGKRRGPSLTETVYGVRTRTVHSLWGKKLTERKNTKLRHAYIIIIIGYLTTGHSSTKECVTPFFLFFL